MANNGVISGQNDYRPILFKYPLPTIVLALNLGGGGGGDLNHISKNQIIRRILEIWRINFFKIALNQGEGI